MAGAIDAAHRAPAPPRGGGNPIVRYVLRYRWQYALGFVALLAASLTALLPPFILRDAVDAIEGGTTRGELARFGAMILGLAVIESVARFGSRLLVSGTAYRLQYDLRNDLADHLLTLDQRFYVGSRTGDLMSRATQDLQWLRDFTGPTLIDVTRTVVMLILGLGFLLTIDVRLALIAMAYLPFVSAAVAYFETEVERRYLQVTRQFGELANRVQESISGVRAVKAHALEDIEIAWFTRDNEEMMGRSLTLARYTSGLFPVMILASGVSTGLVLWFGGRDVVSGRITIGEFVQFGTYLAILAAQLSAVGWIIASWQQGIVSWGRVSEVLRTVPTVDEPSNPRPPAEGGGELRFEGVTASFEGQDVLHDFDLVVPAGDTMAVVGATGSGKTTLANLLVRLADPTAGRVTIDGVDVRELALRDLRDLVAFVPQESFLFSDSLRDNIAFGRPEATDEELARAVATSQLENDLVQFADGLDTVIGERGVTLSGGQKQRAALARALVKDAPILVLDDALSHVDTHTEEGILRRLRAYMADRTTLLIAHRTSTLRSADEIVLLAEGRIAERGTHDQLIALDGAYARLYREQQHVEASERGATDVEASAVETPGLEPGIDIETGDTSEGGAS
ncbi:MAG: ABC transporter ATP-binding protein [Dehalococcoidia bacterium]